MNDEAGFFNPDSGILMLREYSTRIVLDIVKFRDQCCDSAPDRSSLKILEGAKYKANRLLDYVLKAGKYPGRNGEYGAVMRDVLAGIERGIITAGETGKALGDIYKAESSAGVS